MSKDTQQDKQTIFRFSPRPNRAIEIGWRPWGTKAFDEARQADKPVLLAISASWCHWCHLMDETTYSDEEIIELIRDEYIPIRFDTDQHPDINVRYNMGGWPSTVILTPQGDVLRGGTYIEPDQLYNLLVETSDYYQEHKAQIASQAARQEVEHEQRTPSAGRIGSYVAQQVTAVLARDYDAENGGFGQAPKFLHPDALELLLQSHYYTHNEQQLEMVVSTLRKLPTREIFDRVGGGFFRYSSASDWRDPHYEKLLDDNASMLRACLQVVQIDPVHHADIAGTTRQILQFVQRTLYESSTHNFQGSQAADETYYKRTADERARYTPPAVDFLAYTAWSANMASAYLLAGLIQEEKEYGRQALEVLETLWKQGWGDQGMCRSYFNGRSGGGLLVDQVWMGCALLDAYEFTGAREWLRRASTLTEWLLAHLKHEKLGGFYDRLHQQTDVGRLVKDERPLIENAHAAELLLRLGRLIGQKSYEQEARSTLESFSREYAKLGYFAAIYPRVIERLLRESQDFTIIRWKAPGEVALPAEDPLHHMALQIYAPNKTVRLLTAADPLDRQEIERLGYGWEGSESSVESVAFVCVGKACTAPVFTPEALQQSFLELQEGKSPPKD